MIRGNVFFQPIYILALVASASLQAQESTDQEQLGEFLNLLDEQTSLATNTRLNTDFVPGMMTVIDSQTLSRRGFRDLWQALASIPGVQTSINKTGMRSLSVRGVGGLFEPAKIKLLLNGLAQNASASATSGTIYDTPTDQIERIEFIRGPGSAIHGEFAYAGVLNVITRDQGQDYSVNIDSASGAGLSARHSYRNDASDLQASINVAASQSDGEDVRAGNDRLPTASYAPGPVNNKRDFASAIINLEVGDYSGIFQLQQGNRGDHYGSNNLLPPDRKQTVISETTISLGLRREFELSEPVNGSWELNGLRNRSEKNQLFLGPAEAFGGFGNEDDITANTDLVEDRLEVKFNLSTVADKHTLFGEIQLANVEVSESSRSINLDPVTYLPSSDQNAFPGPVNSSLDRNSLSLVVQDEFAFNRALTLTSGIRIDEYEDIDTSFSPRFALVWRKTDEQIYKAQLARAFRPPSLIETGGAIGASIDPEFNDSLELGHIYNGNELILRNTLYYSELRANIAFQDSPPFGYHNTSSIVTRGYELEIEAVIAPDWQLESSLSLQDSSSRGSAGETPWAFKLNLAHELSDATTVNFFLNSTAKRGRAAGDPRSDFAQVNRLDLSVQHRNWLSVVGLDLRFGIINLLDESIDFQAASNSYADDYPYSDGALFWAQVSFVP